MKRSKQKAKGNSTSSELYAIHIAPPVVAVIPYLKIEICGPSFSNFHGLVYFPLQTLRTTLCNFIF
jgi:hypothetical protein